VNRQIVSVGTAADDADDLVDGRVDDVMNVAGVVALKDPYGDTVVRVESRYPLCCGKG
jgi:hypothetical protein